jgi:hypothetical protein
MLFEKAESRRRLASIDQPHRGSAHSIDEPAGQRGDAAKSSYQVEGRALGGQDRPHRAFDLCQNITGVHLISVRSFAFPPDVTTHDVEAQNRSVQASNYRVLPGFDMCTAGQLGRDERPGGDITPAHILVDEEIDRSPKRTFIEKSHISMTFNRGDGRPIPAGAGPLTVQRRSIG